MWIIQEPNKLALSTKLHFEEKKAESIEHVQNIQYLYLLNKYIKCNVWRLAVRYDPYMGRQASNGYSIFKGKENPVEV